MKSTLSIAFLDSQRILEKYFHEGSLNNKELQNYLFVEAHAKDPYKPDYIFKNAMEDFTKKESEDIDAYYLNDSKISKSTNDLLFDTFAQLSSMLVFQGEKIYVNNQRFEKWQNTILSVSPLLIISYAIYKRSKESFRINPEELVKSIFSKTALPSIYEPQLDRIINGGLNEMHMPLSGTTEVDMVWHDALQQPQKFYSYIKKSLNASTVMEQYLQIGNFKQDDFYKLLKIASQIRDQMLLMIYNQCDKKDYFRKDSFDIAKPLYYASHSHPISLIESICLDSKMQYESLFMIRSLEYLACSQSVYFGHLFHYYILIYSYFQKLLVQQKTQVGFDQFQKITLNELRETTEKEHYNNRYDQLQGMYDNSLSVLEGRFAPKEDLKGMLGLLKNIHAGYDKKIQKKYKLKLVPHFTKHIEKRNPEKIITFRDLELRLKNKKTLDVLLESMKYHNDKGQYIYKELIVGFDSAANELHASPETFSPIFRKLAFLGYKNFTYHAGEDFVHILSGLRMVYEAVDFLEMKSGNRIGHATALGIEPKLWEQRLYDSKLTIK